jgi:hypothetical protein
MKEQLGNYSDWETLLSIINNLQQMRYHVDYRRRISIVVLIYVVHQVLNYMLVVDVVDYGFDAFLKGRINLYYNF